MSVNDYPNLKWVKNLVFQAKKEEHINIAESRNLLIENLFLKNCYIKIYSSTLRLIKSLKFLNCIFENCVFVIDIDIDILSFEECILTNIKAEKIIAGDILVIDRCVLNAPSFIHSFSKVHLISSYINKINYHHTIKFLEVSESIVVDVLLSSKDLLKTLDSCPTILFDNVSLIGIYNLDVISAYVEISNCNFITENYLGNTYTLHCYKNAYYVQVKDRIMDSVQFEDFLQQTKYVFDLYQSQPFSSVDYKTLCISPIPSLMEIVKFYHDKGSVQTIYEVYASQ